MHVFKQLLEITTYKENGKRKIRTSVVPLLLGAGLLFFILPIVFAVIFMIYSTYDEVKNRPKAERTQADLEKEFRRIEPLPNAIPIEQPSSTYKTDGGVVSCSYKTNLNYGEIRAYYDVELAKHGWKFQGEKNVIYRGEASGGKQAFYFKGDYTAIMQYAGQLESEFGWTFGISLSWGLHNRK